MDTTTIEITDDQKDDLDDLKQHDRESYKAVLDRLLDGDTGGTNDKKLYQREHEATMEEIREAAEQLDRIENAVESGSGDGPVQLDATEYSKIADEIEGRLR